MDTISSPQTTNNQVAPENELQKLSNKIRVRRNRVLFVASVVLLALLAGFGGSAIYGTLQKPITQLTRSNGQDGNAVVSSGEADIASVAAKMSPSVVSVVTTMQSQQGAGTGIIISAGGYIMTNKHVISDATSISVVAADGTTYDNVKLVGTDPLNDIAFLKIDGAKTLQPAQIGDSSTIRIGQSVVAIGNALGQYQNTVTSGIISGTGRPVSAQAGQTVETLTDLLQTDASINPGNSGGPLVNMAGQVIGINTAIASDGAGIGFAIPINATKGVIEGVLATGKVSRAYLGVNYQTITPEVVKQYNLPVSKGAYVMGSNSSAVVKNGPADKAGVQDKDIITKVNDIVVGENGSVASLIGEYKPGDTVQLTVLRGGKTLEIPVTLAAYGN